MKAALVLLTFGIAGGGCASDTPMNPSFPVTRKFAHAAIEEMDSDLLPLPRPVIVLGGIHDPGFVAPHVADVIRDTTRDRTQVIAISFFEGGTFDTCAEKVIRKVDEAFPSDDSSRTVEVDVVGYSMGGVVARQAASDDYFAKHGRRLRIARLFTISTPHTGAELAELPTLDARVKDMRDGSPFLARLNGEGAAAATAPASQPTAGGASYELFTYVRLHDGVVGEEHAAPPGVTPWWVPNGLSASHLLAAYDDRIMADILRRLRGQEPLTTSPPHAFPAGY